MEGAYNIAGYMNYRDYDVKLMLNNDMVAHNTMQPGDWNVRIYAYTGSEHYAAFGAALAEVYTNLSYTFTLHNSSGSDSFAFWVNGFPVTYYEELEFSPYWHTPYDIIENCDIDFCTEIAMHIAATAPRFISREEVDSDLIEKEKEIYREVALNEGKPENIVDRIVEGKIGKYYEQVCLLEQPWIRDGDKKIEDLLNEKIASLGENIRIARFARFALGESN